MQQAYSEGISVELNFKKLVSLLLLLKLLRNNSKSLKTHSGFNFVYIVFGTDS